MYIYCDAVKYQIIADTQAQLLATLPFQRTSNHQCFGSFNPRYHISVNQNTLCSLEIRICTDIGDLFHSTHLAELLSNCILDGNGPFYKSCIKAGHGCKFCSIFLMSNSIKWTIKVKIFISNCIIKEAAIFQFFKAHVTFNMAMGLGTFCEIFFLMC